jgi:hypothetical protein
MSDGDTIVDNEHKVSPFDNFEKTVEIIGLASAFGILAVVLYDSFIKPTIEKRKVVRTASKVRTIYPDASNPDVSTDPNSN